MAIDLSAATTMPLIHYKADYGTTWTEILIPEWADASVIPETGDIFVAAADNGVPGSIENPEDGGAAGTHKRSIIANQEWLFRRGTKLGPNQKPDSVGRFYIAAQAGTEGVSIELIRRGIR